MQGLELCQSYFEEVGLPMLQRIAPQLLEKLAAGLVGDGSECFGYDDEISRDHDWGPSFCAWLSREDFTVHGRVLHSALDGLPKTHRGYSSRMESQWGGGRVGVLCTEDFYMGFTGLDRPPRALDEWLAIPENNLAVCTNGRVFMDGAGVFTAWRDALLGFYPEDVRIKKIASRCMTIGQSGQYNFSRCVQRGHAFSTHYSLVKFCSDVLSLVFLLNRRYAPYFKWLHKASEFLPILGSEMYGAVDNLLARPDMEKQKEVIEEICGLLIAELRNQGLTEGKSDFMADHGPLVQKRIQDPGLAARNVWVG